jgi:hypothetical protein
MPEFRVSYGKDEWHAFVCHTQIPPGCPHLHEDHSFNILRAEAILGRLCLSSPLLRKFGKKLFLTNLYESKPEQEGGGT